jgi:hypothetical protein
MMVLYKCRIWDRTAQRIRRCKNQATDALQVCFIHNKKCGSRLEGPWTKWKDKVLLVGCRARIAILQKELRRLRIPKKKLHKVASNKNAQTLQLLQMLLMYLRERNITEWEVAKARALRELNLWHSKNILKTSNTQRERAIDELYRHFTH